MKTIICKLIMVLSCILTSSVSWGEEIKLKPGHGTISKTYVETSAKTIITEEGVWCKCNLPTDGDGNCQQYQYQQPQPPSPYVEFRSNVIQLAQGEHIVYPEKDLFYTCSP